MNYELISLIALAIIAALIVPTLIPYLQNILFMSSTVERYDPEMEERVFQSSHARIDEAIALDMGFEREGAYLVDLKMAKAVFAMWRHKTSTTFLAVFNLGESLLNSNAHIDLVSVLSLDPNVGLTTGTTKDGHTDAKLPGDYVQSFSNLPIQEMFDLHMTGEAYVATRHRIKPEPVRLTGAEALLISLRDNSRKKLLRPWLALQVPWRYWIGRHMNHNKTVEQIHGSI